MKSISFSVLIDYHLGSNLCLGWQSRTSGSQWTLEVMRWLAWMRWPRLFSALRTRTFPSITFQAQRVCVVVTQTTHWSKRSSVGLQQWNWRYLYNKTPLALLRGFFNLWFGLCNGSVLQAKCLCGSFMKVIEVHSHALMIYLPSFPATSYLIKPYLNLLFCRMGWELHTSGSRNRLRKRKFRALICLFMGHPRWWVPKPRFS